MLMKIVIEFQDHVVHVIRDNARYQKCNELYIFLQPKF